MVFIQYKRYQKKVSGSGHWAFYSILYIPKYLYQHLVIYVIMNNNHDVCEAKINHLKIQLIYQSYLLKT